MADSKQYRTKFYQTSAVFLVLVAVVLVLLNLTSDKTSRLKIDLSKDKIYSISPATRSIVGELKDNISVTYYCSREIASFLPNLLRDTIDMFEEFRRLSNGRFTYEIIDPDVKADEYAYEKTEEYLKNKKDPDVKDEDLEEPEPAQDPMSLFNPRRQQPTADEIRENRDKLASALARQTQREKDAVYRELLIEEWKEKYERDLEAESVIPQVIEDRTGSSVRQRKVYSTIKLTYLSRQPEVIPFHRSLESLEYELAHRVVKLTTEVKPTVAFFDAKKPAMPPFNPMQPRPQMPMSDYQAVIQQVLSDLFTVREITLKEGDAIDDLVRDLKREKLRREREDRDESEPDDPDEEVAVEPEDLRLVNCLIVAQPDGLEERQIYEINRAVSRGVPTIFLVSPFSTDVSPQGMQGGFPIATIKDDLGEMFRKWGVELGDEMLASNESSLVVIQSRGRQIGGLTMVSRRPQRMSCILRPRSGAINQESPFTNNVQAMVFPATSGLELNTETLDENGIECTELVSAAKESWSVRVDPFAMARPNPMMPNQSPGPKLLDYMEDLVMPKDPERFRDFLEEEPVLAVYLKGKMPFIFEGESVPEWVKAPEAEGPGEGGPGVGGPGFGGMPGGFEDGDAIPDAAEPAPAETTAAPAETTPAPAETTPAPAETTPAPAETTPAPAETTPAPAETTPAPAETTPAPAETAAEPAPAETATVPAETAAEPAPAETTPAPAEETASAPGEDGKAPEKPAETAHVELAEGRVLVLSSVDMLKNSFLVNWQDDPAYSFNINFLLNAVELFALDDTLSQVRRKTVSSYQFEPDSERSAGWIQYLNTLVVPGLILIAGIAYLVIRWQGSVAYERQYIRKHKIG